jgi:CRISPR-associated protein Csd1
MIRELVQYADSLPISGREPLRSRPVHWLIDLEETGKVLGITPTCAATTSKKSGALGERRGKRFSIPANYLLGSPNQHNWRPDFLTGPADEILLRGVHGVNPSPKKRRAFWEIVVRAKHTMPDNKCLNAIWRFLRTTRRLTDLPLPPSARENLGWFKKSQNTEGETIGFRVAGLLASRDTELSKWWKATEFPKIHADQTAEFVEVGEDAFQAGTGRITASSPCVFGNVPLVSFNNAPFCSFGLGEQTARLRLDTVEKAAAAINALRQNDSTSLNLGDEKAIFWAVQNNRVVDCSFITLLEAKDPLAVADYLKSVWGNVPRELDHAAFHVAILQEGTGRFSVRSWQCGFLGDVDRRLRNYFDAIRLPTGMPVNLGAMARSTIQKTKKDSKTTPSSLTYNGLFETALRAVPLPFRLLRSAATRQSVELAKGRSEEDKGDFESRLRARTALIKLYFFSNQKEPKDKPMNEQHHDKQDHPAYLCGRVLALLDKIHNAAHGKSTASSPAGRYYGSASSTPALVFPRLCKLANIHLEKIGGGLAYKLQQGVAKDKSETPIERDFEGLAQLIARFSADAKWPRTLSLEDQGRFAIGFYYERCRKWPRYRKGANPKGDEAGDDSQTGDTDDSNKP